MLSDHDGWNGSRRLGIDGEKKKKRSQSEQRGGEGHVNMMAGSADASLVAVAVGRWGIVLLSSRGKQNHSSLGLASIWATPQITIR